MLIKRTRVHRLQGLLGLVDDQRFAFGDQVQLAVVTEQPISMIT